MTSYNGEAITHNPNGCPTTYNGYAITWQNGKLTRFRMGMKLTGMYDYTYSYNGLGQRIKRSYKYTAGSLVGGSNNTIGYLINTQKTKGTEKIRSLFFILNEIGNIEHELFGFCPTDAGVGD